MYTARLALLRGSTLRYLPSGRGVRGLGSHPVRAGRGVRYLRATKERTQSTGKEGGSCGGPPDHQERGWRVQREVVSAPNLRQRGGFLQQSLQYFGGAQHDFRMTSSRISHAMCITDFGRGRNAKGARFRRARIVGGHTDSIAGEGSRPLLT